MTLVIGGGCASLAPVSHASDADAVTQAPGVGDGQSEHDEALLDRAQRTVHGLVAATSDWFDGFFGSSEFDSQTRVSRGLVAVGMQWDERDELEARLRMKASVRLPALERRARLLFGRGDAEDIVDGTASENIDTLPRRFNPYQDEDWLLGVGYGTRAGLARGWDFDIGVKLSTPIEPLARVTWRSNRTLGQSWLWRFRPQAFWQDSRGAGVSLTNTIDYAATEKWLLRSWSVVVAEEEVDGLAWTGKLVAYQRLSQDDALTYSVFASGETRAEVSLQDYGAELRYRRRFLREWLFLELATSLSWPREQAAVRRESNLGFGVELEMQFGDWPGRTRSRAPRGRDVSPRGPARPRPPLPP